MIRDALVLAAGETVAIAMPGIAAWMIASTGAWELASIIFAFGVVSLSIVPVAAVGGGR